MESEASMIYFVLFFIKECISDDSCIYKNKTSLCPHGCCGSSCCNRLPPAQRFARKALTSTTSTTPAAPNPEEQSSSGSTTVIVIIVVVIFTSAAAIAAYSFYSYNRYRAVLPLSYASTVASPLTDIEKEPDKDPFEQDACATSSPEYETQPDIVGKPCRYIVVCPKSPDK